MRLAKVLNCVLARIPIAAAIVAAGPLIAVGQNGNVRYAPAGFAQADSQTNDSRSAASPQPQRGPLLGGGQSFQWPKMPFARSKPSDRKLAAPSAIKQNMPQTSANGQRFAARQMNGAAQSRTQMPAAAMSANANMRRVPQQAQIPRAAQSTNQAAGPIPSQAIQVANRPRTAPTTPATRPTAPQVAPLSPIERLLAQANELSNTARTEDEFTRIITTCGQAQTAQADPSLTAYASELCSWALNRRGQLKAEAGRDQEAIRDFNEAIQSDSKRWRAFHNRGVLLAQLGDFKKAFDDFNHTIEAQPNFAKAYSNRGALFVVAGNLSAAADDYCQAIELDPKLAIAHRGYARACHLMGDLQEAMRQYDCAVELAPDDAYAIASRADVLTDLGQFAEAAGEYERAIRIDPRSGHGYSGSAWLLATCPDHAIRNSKLAIERAQKGLELNGDGDAASFDTLAAAQASAGDFAAAVQNIREAIDLAAADERDAYEDRLMMYEASEPYRLDVTEDVQQASYETESAKQGAEGSLP